MRDFYQLAATVFSREEAPHRLLLALAADESQHAVILKMAMDRAKSPLFDEPQMNALMERTNALDLHLRAEIAKPYANFNILYMRINSLETSEINNIFEILATGVLKEPNESGPIRDMIKDHILRVTDFGHHFDRHARLKMLPRPLPSAD
jgi:hypothetical protein